MKKICLFLLLFAHASIAASAATITMDDDFRTNLQVKYATGAPAPVVQFFLGTLAQTSDMGSVFKIAYAACSSSEYWPLGQKLLNTLNAAPVPAKYAAINQAGQKRCQESALNQIKNFVGPGGGGGIDAYRNPQTGVIGISGFDGVVVPDVEWKAFKASMPAASLPQNGLAAAPDISLTLPAGSKVVLPNGITFDARGFTATRPVAPVR